MQYIDIQESTYRRLVYVTQQFIPGMKTKFSAERSLYVCLLHSDVSRAVSSINRTHPQCARKHEVRYKGVYTLN